MPEIAAPKLHSDAQALEAGRRSGNRSLPRRRAPSRERGVDCENEFLEREMEERVSRGYIRAA